MRILKLLMILMLTLTITAQAAENDPYQKVWETATEEDITALEQVIWYEAGRADCPQEVLIAVCETVLNRCLSDTFPSTIKAVCYQTGQFYYYKSKINSKAVSEAISYVQKNGRTVTTAKTVCFATKMQSIAKNHYWVGERKADGKPRKGKGMYFAELKE